MIEKFYLGTYTKRKSQGIYSILLDTTKKKLSTLTLEGKNNNPTYLNFSPDHSLLATVSKEEGHGGITVYAVDNDHALTKISHHHDTNAVPCYVAWNAQQTSIVTANYHEALASLYHVTPELQFIDRKAHAGSSIHPNQTQAHVHFTDYTPDGKWMMACDLGTDSIVTYQEQDQELVEVARYHTTPGAGPRHLAFHPTLPVFYVICELNASIEVLQYHAEDGTLTNLEVIPLTTADQQAWGGAIHVTADGRFVYATNRGYDRIYAFAVNETTGTLTLVEDYDTFGSVPRDFTIDETQHFILIGHQESDNLTLYERDAEKGTLTLCEKDFYAPEVVCIKQQ